MSLPGNHDDAIKYQNKRRAIDPAVYNHRRLKEKPLPAKRNLQKKRTSTQRNTQPKQHTEYVQQGNVLVSLEEGNSSLVDTFPYSFFDTPPNTPLNETENHESETEIETNVSLNMLTTIFQY